MKSRLNFRRGLFFVLCLVPPGVAVFSPGCGGAPGEYCDLLCECEKCSDLKEDDCNISAHAQQDTAEAYGCDDDFNDWIQCAIDDNNCDEQTNNWQEDESCVDERTNWQECIRNASDHTTSGQQQVSVAQQSVVNTTPASTAVSTTASSTAGVGGMGGMGGMGIGGAGGN